MATKIEICNMALAHLGTGKTIASIDERSSEARALKQFWDIALQSFCQEFTFPFTKKIVALALVEADPNSEWGFSYRYPNDCLVIKRILSGIRNDTRNSRIPFQESHDVSGKLIYTDKEDAEIEYAAPLTNPAHFGPSFALALSYKLAYLISPTITGGNAFTGITKSMLEMYGMQSALCREVAANEIQADIQPESEFTEARY